MRRYPSHTHPSHFGGQSPPVTNLGHKYMINGDKFILRYKDMPDSGVSPYIRKSYEACDKLWALEVHATAKLSYGNLVANYKGKNITFVKGTDITKDLYLIDCITEKGSKFIIPAQGTTPASVACINYGTMKVMIGNLPEEGLPATTDASSQALIDIFKASLAISSTHDRNTGYVDKVGGAMTWVAI